MLHSRGRHAVLLWHGDDPDVSFLDHLDAARWREQLAVIVVNGKASFCEIMMGDKVCRCLWMIEAFGRHFQEVRRACGRHERDGDGHDFGRQALASYDTAEFYVTPMVLGDKVRVVHDGYFRLSVRVEAL